MEVMHGRHLWREGMEGGRAWREGGHVGRGGHAGREGRACTEGPGLVQIDLMGREGPEINS